MMKLRTWVSDNITNYNSLIKTEEDVKMHIVVPFLREQGYDLSEMRFENTIDVQIGTKKTSVRSDIEITIDGKVQLIIDAKGPQVAIAEKQILQSSSYAKLISTPPAVYALTTNGLECVVTNIYTGQRTDQIPSKEQLIRDITKTRKKELTDIEIREIKSVLLTLHSHDDLYKVIKRCKEVIEKRALIRSDQSFKEMTKVLLVKMNEERRAKNGEPNRFLLEYIQKWARVDQVNELFIFKKLFEDAKESYPAIYSQSEESLKIMDNPSIVEIVSQLEPWSFLGTGDDIKGAVYEIFLRSTLRGEFDQYFTPREIVDYIVRFSDPNIGDKILDPACGSGGFLIQSFNYVNQKIIDSPFSEVELNKKFKNLIDKCLWGHEADEDLHVLAKINLIMHGDGYNNIFQGDTLRSDKLPDNYFDLILTNPPFTIRYNFKDVLSNYDLGIGKESEELDILFVEKCVKALNASNGGELYIVLPEGLLNVPTYVKFRTWLLERCFITTVVSLPEGAFIPFGKSVSKTTIIGLRKKDLLNPNNNKPTKIFIGNAKEVGYEVGRSDYKIKSLNDLQEFLIKSQSTFEGISFTPNGGECGWINQEEISPKRIDASYLLNSIDKATLHLKFKNLQPLKEICEVKNVSHVPRKDRTYFYLEITDIAPNTGTIMNIREVKGTQIASSMNIFKGGDLLLSRINPRKNRVTVIPEDVSEGLVSKEAYILRIKKNKFITNKFVLCAILQSTSVKNQIVRLATGSSSSRARVPESDLLEYVYIPVPDKSLQNEIEQTYPRALGSFWRSSQALIDSYVDIQNKLLSHTDKNHVSDFL